MTFSQVIRERGVDASLFSGSAICEDGAYLYLTALSSPTLFGVSYPFLPARLSGGSELLYVGTKTGVLLWFVINNHYHRILLVTDKNIKNDKERFHKLILIKHH